MQIQWSVLIKTTIYHKIYISVEPAFTFCIGRGYDEKSNQSWLKEKRSLCQMLGKIRQSDQSERKGNLV